MSLGIELIKVVIDMFEVIKEKVQLERYMKGFGTLVRNNGKVFVIIGKTREELRQNFLELVSDIRFDEKHVTEVCFGQNKEQKDRKVENQNNFLYNKDKEFSLFQKV